MRDLKVCTTLCGESVCLCLPVVCVMFEICFILGSYYLEGVVCVCDFVGVECVHISCKKLENEEEIVSHISFIIFLQFLSS